MLERYASFAARNRKRLLSVAILAIVVAGVAGLGVAKTMSPYGDTDPASQSVQATNRYEAAANRQIDPGIIALVRVDDIHSARTSARINDVESRLRATRDIAKVSSYLDTHDAAMVSRDGRTTYVVGYFKRRSDLRIQEDAKQVERAFADQADVTLGGAAIADEQVNTQVGNDLARAELIAFPFIFLLSLLFFRSIVAALLPPLIGGLAILVTFFALRVVSEFTTLSVFALNIVTGLGLGLAIDYSLFTVSRYREESAKDGFGAAALRRTLSTSGRTIVFSSITVAAALASLIVFPQLFLRSMGIAGALVALAAASVALLVLPALLAVLGRRINALAPKWLQRAAEREARPAESGFWYRLSQTVIARPRTIAALSAAVLLVTGLPFASVKFLPADAGVLPATASAHKVDRALHAQFPSGRTTPIEVVVGASSSSKQVRDLISQFRRLPNIANVAPAEPAGPAIALVRVATSTPPYSHASRQVVHEIRRLQPGVYLGVAGDTAGYMDLEHSLGTHLPVVLALVIASTLIVLLLMTGSLVLGAKAVVMNALSLSAVFGVLVLIFQHGNLQGVLSYRSTGSLDATQPILLFAIGFALATDYAVFLLSRIKEERDNGASDNDAVSIGLERTGRVVTAAALLFSVAIGAFVSSKVIFIKELGLGTALAVLIDATVIRALLVPSLMVMLGPWNWWAPRPLRRLGHAVSKPAPEPALGATNE